MVRNQDLWKEDLSDGGGGEKASFRGVKDVVDRALSRKVTPNGLPLTVVCLIVQVF